LSPTELLDAAQAMIRQPRPETVGLWPRAAALLGRQALEEALDDLWRREAPELQGTSTTCQLVCLPVFVPDRQLAGQAAHVWGVLTHACHHHPYELSPTAEELDRWLEVVDAVICHLQAPRSPRQRDDARNQGTTRPAADRRQASER
jgi:hypothetical protein